MKDTNLDKVKSTAIDFLYLDVEQSDRQPMLVYHPFFVSVMANLPDYGLFNILEDMGHLEEVRQIYRKNIMQAENVCYIMDMITEPYKLGFFKCITLFLSQKDLSELLSQIWVNIENPNQDVNASITDIVKWFGMADKQSLMQPQDYKVYCSLPDSFPVYRGVAIGRNPNGLSWTRNLDKAKWFAHRFDNKEQQGYVRESQIFKKDVLAYFNTRGEEEIVVYTKQ